MTQQQIIDAGIDYTMQNYPVCIAGGALADMARQMNRNPSFEAGAKWAKEELIKEVCEWLEQHQESYDMYDAWSGDFVNFRHLIIDLHKAMEGYGNSL